MTAFGIDLGTTYSCVARIDETGRAVVLKNAVGEDTTPSVVYFESPDNVVVGRAAKDSALLAPDQMTEVAWRSVTCWPISSPWKPALSTAPYPSHPANALRAAQLWMLDRARSVLDDLPQSLAQPRELARSR